MSEDQPSILRVIGSDTVLHRVANGTHGVEFAGPCPQCGGTDRFHVQTRTNRCWCRQCSPTEHWLSPADYVMQKHGCTYPEALKLLEEVGGEPADRQVIREARSEQPDPAVEETMRRLSDAAASRIWEPGGNKARKYLYGRGLKDATIDKFKLGYHPGSPELPKCITIPHYGTDGHLYALKGRLPLAANGRKYVQVAGGRSCLFGQRRAKSTLLLLEGEFDVMTAWQEVGELLDAATLGSCSAQPTPRQAATFVNYRTLLVAYDQDEAGQRGAARWDWLGHARRVQYPIGVKDLNAMHLAGHDIKGWVEQQLRTDWNEQESRRMVDSTLSYISNTCYTELEEGESALLVAAVDEAMYKQDRAALIGALTRYQIAFTAAGVPNYAMGV